MKEKNRNFNYLIILIGFLLIITSSCKKTEENIVDPKLLPVVTTKIISNITINTASGGGEIISFGFSAVTVSGICWSTKSNPTTSDNKTIDGPTLGAFVSEITGLVQNTTYYVRAYGKNNSGTGYGTQVSFKTLADCPLTVSDTDGNVYPVIKQDKQCWMKENLKVLHYRNGVSIPNVTSNSTWTNLSTGAYCDYANTPSNSTIYGRIYNGYAVKDSRMLCPTGWHVPTNSDWTTLVTYLGGTSVAGGKMKETGTVHWTSPNTSATNTSGFTALPGGYRDSDFNPTTDLGLTGAFWSSTAADWQENAWYLTNTSSQIVMPILSKSYGHSVRCIRN